MDNKTRLILMEVILLVLILSFCLVVEIRSNIFKRDCKETYDINGSCPCKQTRLDHPILNLTYKR